MDQLKFGIAGFGKMGKIREIAISNSQEAELIAIFEINDYQYSDDSVIQCKSFDELLSTESDAVIISSYVSVAAEYVIRALNAGKHVFCEKPPAMNANEMLAVIEAEKNSDKVLKYGFNHRFHYSVMEAKKIINEEALGKLLWMRGVYGKAGSIDFHENWRNFVKMELLEPKAPPGRKSTEMTKIRFIIVILFAMCPGGVLFRGFLRFRGNH